MADIEIVKQRIYKAMKSQNTYSDDLDMAINTCAGAYISTCLAMSDILKLKKTYTIEKTREGNKKYVAHPAFSVFSKSSEDLRKYLRELGLTLQTLSSNEDDEVNDLINEVNKAGDDRE